MTNLLPVIIVFIIGVVALFGGIVIAAQYMDTHDAAIKDVINTSLIAGNNTIGYNITHDATTAIGDNAAIMVFILLMLFAVTIIIVIRGVL
jgi:hypothetical protein